MVYYKTFKRSCTGWESFAKARKMTDETELTLEQARQRCDKFNDHRTPAQVRRGTKLEFESM
ncbi:MAG: hypothetical protein WC373_04660 [Smithella sp.]|jgi:hypothetical protein